MKYIITLVIALSLLSCKKDNGYNTNQGGGNSDGKGKFINTSTTVSEGNDPSSNLSSEAKLGQEIFDGKGNCYSCHKPDQKVVGPSIVEIAKIYTEKKGNMVNFLMDEADPIVDPSMYPTMKANVYLTKTFSEEELKALEAYFMSHLSK